MEMTCRGIYFHDDRGPDEGGICNDLAGAQYDRAEGVDDLAVLLES